MAAAAAAAAPPPINAPNTEPSSPVTPRTPDTPQPGQSTAPILDQQQVSANPLFVIQPSPFVSSTPSNLKPLAEEEGSQAGALTKVHVQALDEIVSVNSFFTVAVFIGFSFTNPTVDANLVGKCFVGEHFTKLLLIFEVIAFSSYLLSSLIAQGLKLFIVILNTKDYAEVLSATIKPNTLRLGMLCTIIGTTVGTIFLTLSIAFIIQLRLGLLECNSPWSKWAAIPMITMVTGGLSTFLLSALYAFCM